MKKSPIIDCPTCKKPVAWEPHCVHRPFCSKRCQLIDLGEWATEKKQIASSEDNS